MKSAKLVLTAFVFLAVPALASAQLRTYTGSIQLGEETAAFRLYGPDVADCTLYAGRGSAPQRYLDGQAVLTAGLRAQVVDNRQSGVSRLEMDVRQLIGRKPVSYRVYYNGGSPLSGDVTLNLEGSGVWHPSFVPASITLTSGTATIEKDLPPYP